MQETGRVLSYRVRQADRERPARSVHSDGPRTLARSIAGHERDETPKRWRRDMPAFTATCQSKTRSSSGLHVSRRALQRIDALSTIGARAHDGGAVDTDIVVGPQGGQRHARPFRAGARGRAEDERITAARRHRQVARWRLRAETRKRNAYAASKGGRMSLTRSLARRGGRAGGTVRRRWGGARICAPTPMAPRELVGTEKRLNWFAAHHVGRMGGLTRSPGRGDSWLRPRDVYVRARS